MPPVDPLHLHQQVLARHVEQGLDPLLDGRRLADQRGQVHAVAVGWDQRRQRPHLRRDPDLAAPLAQHGARLTRAAEQRQRQHRLGQRSERGADLNTDQVVLAEVDPPHHDI